MLMTDKPEYMNHYHFIDAMNYTSNGVVFTKKAYRVEYRGKKFYSQHNVNEKSDSSIVAYEFEESTKFARIEYFLTTTDANTVFVSGFEIEVLGDILDLQKEPKDDQMRAEFDSKSYSGFFHLVEFTSNRVHFRVDKILSHCIQVRDSRRNTFLTQVDDVNEHS